MKYKIFGKATGLRVSQFALGTGNFGTRWGHGADKAESKKIFDHYAEAGGNFIDTANGYQFGESEEILSDLIAKDRNHFVLASKYSLPASANASISFSGNSRKNMIHSVEESLKRLKTDHLDILWAHMDDEQTPLEEMLRGFDDLSRSGKILYAGLSNFPAWKISRAATIAELKNWAPIIGVQVEYSMGQRTPERELLPMAKALGLGVAAWSPLAGGFLTGKYRQNSDGTRLKGLGTLVQTEDSAFQTRLLDTLIRVADELKVAPSHVAIAWLLQRDSDSDLGMTPILGPRTLDQLKDNLKGLDVNLSSAQMNLLNENSAIQLGSPHEIIKATQNQVRSNQAERFV
jgi:aryl-alcohol dehydrogenase-like predicted oxidoreductase